jgi:hypothetical protein
MQQLQQSMQQLQYSGFAHKLLQRREYSGVDGEVD